MRAFRLEQGWTYERFAKKCKVTVTALKRAEQAVYTAIPPKIYRAMHQVDPGMDFKREYQQYQLEKRQETFAQIAPVPSPRITDRNTWDDWIERCGFESHLAACSGFCVHPFSVANWSNGRNRTIPKQLEEALLQAGFNPEFIQRLAECQKEWRLGKLRAREEILNGIHRAGV